MPEPTDSEKPLPFFRQDLQLLPGPMNSDGSPTYVLFDPVRSLYFRITWAESLIFKLFRPGMNMRQLTETLEEHSTLKVSPSMLESFFKDAAVNSLLDVRKRSEVLIKEAQMRETSWFKWLLYHYLYIRVPLITPDRFLERTLKYILPLASPVALCIYGALIVLGLILLISRFEEFIHTFSYFFTIQGFLIYASAITCVKVIHEFSHAYTAKYYHTQVPHMGAAFIVFWPVLYTNVTDSWRLHKRSQRIAIAFAGIFAELILAGMATLGWAMTSPGMLQSAFFVIASVTWISTLIVNLNPALRFDGYYILSDLWGIDNLQPRTFAMTRWQLRKWLLGVDVPPPEEHVSRSQLAGMMVYSLYTWLYRLGLYTAIAIFVYHQFTKLLGIFLFFVEIGIFIIWPIASEIHQLRTTLRPFLSFNRRSVTTLTVITLLFLWAVLPYPHKESFPGITVPEDQQLVYVPVEGRIESIYVKRGDKVQLGQELVSLTSKSLEKEIGSTELDKEITDREIITASQNIKDVPLIADKEATKSALEAKLATLYNLRDLLSIKALVSGVVFEWDENLAPYQSVAKDQVLGKVADLTRVEVLAFVPEQYISMVQLNQKATFRLQRTLEQFDGRVTKIHPVRTSDLIYPQLSSLNKGPLPVIQDPTSPETHKLVESYFMVTIKIDSPHPDLRLLETGSVGIRGPWESYLMYVLREITAIFWKEGSF